MKRANIQFVVIAALTVTAYWSVMSLRYTWFLTDRPYAVLVGITLSAIAVIVALWLLFPSRILTAVTSAVGFALPPILMPETFVELDLGFAPFALSVIGLVVLATHIRYQSIGNRKHAL